MSGHFPFFPKITHLLASDFHFFAAAFARAVRAAIPTASDVVFLRGGILSEALAEQYSNQFSMLPGLHQALQVCGRDAAPLVLKDCFLLPCAIADGPNRVALVSGVDPLLVGRAAQDWLLEIRDDLQQQFLAIRQAATDPQTRLFNNGQLQEDLAALVWGDRLDLILVEVYPRVRTGLAAMQAVRQSVSLLKSIIGETLPLYYLGQGMFAILGRNVAPQVTRRLAPAIISILKRERLPRAHVGCSQGIVHSDDDGDGGLRPNGLRVFDQAWDALQAACKRGPFGLCLHDSLEQPEYQALARPSRRVAARFQRHWQDLERFVLIQIQGLAEGQRVGQILATAGHAPLLYYDDQGDCFVLLPDCDPGMALDIARDLQDRLHSAGAGERSEKIAVGIAPYPLAASRKSEAVLNCRRALLHGALLGEGQIVVCDALSYNVSGDVFFSEGDLPRAVRDYRQGLLLAPGEVNLLNSLGVAHVLMNHQRQAMSCFEQVLAMEPDNFMALYNLGLGQEQQGDDLTAVATFEQALAVSRVSRAQGAEVSEPPDFGLQLGRLYCRTKRFQQALDCLAPWYEQEQQAPRGGQALRFLGEACYGVGRFSEAERWLQRALRFDEFDAAAMSLLGLIYLEQNQGARIALSLCEKSVELQPDVTLFYLRQAQAQRRCEMYDEARNSLRLCLRRKETRGAAQLEMAKLYQALGQESRARAWLVKIRENGAADPAVVAEAHRLLSNNKL